MTDQPVTHDREALALTATRHVLAAHYPPDIDSKNAQRVRDQCWTAVDALLPLLTEALDRARQQGRDEAAAAIEERREAIRFCSTQSAFEDLHSSLRRSLVHFDEAAALARGGPNRKDEE